MTNVSNSMSTFISAIGRALRRRRTERLIEALSPELRKDIGWPGATQGNQAPGRREFANLP